MKTGATAEVLKPHLPTAAAVLLLSLVLGTAIAVQPLLALGLAGALVVAVFWLQTPAWAVVALTCIAVFQPLLLRMVPDTAEFWLLLKRLDEFSLAFVTPFAVLKLLRDSRSPFNRLTVVSLVTVFLIGVIGVGLNDTPLKAASLDSFLLFKGFLFFTFVTAFPLGERRSKLLFQLLLCFTLVAGVLGVAEVFAPDAFRSVIPLARTGYRMGKVCLVSVLESEGQAGWFFAFVATCCFAFYMVYRRMGYLLAFAFFSACSLLTLRRKPLGGLLAMMLVCVLFSSRPTQRMKVIALILGAVLVVGVSFSDTLAPIFIDGWGEYVASADPMKVARNAMYATSFKLAVEHFPIGVGFGLFGGFGSQMYYSPIYYEYGLSRIWGLSPEFSRFMMDAFWPHILGQFGFLGLLAFLLSFYGIWKPILVRFQETVDPWAKAVCLAALLTFVEAMVESGAESIFEGTLPSFLLFGLAALATQCALRSFAPDMTSVRQRP